MSRKTITAAITIFLMLNVCGSVVSQEQPSIEDLERAKITKEMSNSLRAVPIFIFHSGFVYIGDLVSSSHYWKSALLMADNQEVTIKSLDSLLFKAKLASMSDDADYLDTNPRDYKKYMDRSKRRRKAAVKHGQLMTLAGLLKESQANAVIQHYLSTHQARAFHDDLINYVFGFSEMQRKFLTQAQSNYNKNTRPLFLRSMLPNPPDIKADLRRFKDEFASASMAVLTPAQKKKYAQISVKRPLSKSAPVMPFLSEAEQKRINVKELSDVFRAIVHLQNENELKLSEIQKNFLDKLYLVTQRGLFWIETVDASQGDGAKKKLSIFVRSEAEFLKHAEQVALQAILTEHQAKQVRDVM